MARTLLTAAAVLLALAVVLAVSRDDADDATQRIGLNTHLVWAPERELAPTFEQLASAGVEWTREEIPWRLVEPERGRFDWRQTDALFAAASRSGVQILGILGYSAEWATGDPGGDTRHPPADVADYARYARRVLERYGESGAFWRERGELNPQPLRAVEIWNEPWMHATWPPEPDPAVYARLVRAAVEAIRDVAPETTVAIAGDLLQVRTDGSIVPWLEELLRVDPELPELVDVYSVHPYPDPRIAGPYDDRSDPRWDYRRVELVRRLDDSLPIWITEIGWSTAEADGAVDEATQAKYVAGAVERVLDEWEYVERVFVYSFDRDTDDRGDREANYGLIRSDGTTKPAWEALLRAIHADEG